jgi:hypothetical protein
MLTGALIRRIFPRGRASAYPEGSVPNVPAARPERDFCSSCGFPIRGGRCEACGTAQEARRAQGASDDVSTKENPFHPYPSPADTDVAGLERAVEAFLAKDSPRLVEHLLASEAGLAARPVPTPDGVGWVAVIGGALVFVTLRAEHPRDEIVLEAPLARLPGRQRLPALRLALELCARDAATSRVCLRGDLLLLRFTARMSPLTPPVLRYHLREIGHLAARYAGLMTAGLDALPAIADDQRGAVGFDAMGRPKKIQLGGNLQRSIPPERALPARPVTGSARPLRRDDEAPPEPSTHQVPLEVSLRALRSSSSSNRMPAVSAPTQPGAGTMEPGSRAGSYPVPDAATPTRSRQPTADPRAEIESSAGSRGAPSEPLLSTSDRLCMLLRHAQSLGSIAIEERPATMVWLVRSAVFRAIYDFKDTLPDAVAHLYRCTGVGHDAPAARSTSGQLQATEPALVVMERVIVVRAQVPKERALAIEPMTSAGQAREHVARYLLEIDRAPGDPALRHFLALGALTELLVRTKLPPQTDHRLRDIVAHAQREGARGAAIDLMMTALQRINA